MREIEGDPALAEHLRAARRNLRTALDDQRETFRALRLAQGLSQDLLAKRAESTQAYVARIEAGSLDPGTDMIARLASVLGVDGARLFTAVRNQREAGVVGNG